jgi:uncharacterized phage protein (TIGR01671 family)
MKNRHKYRGKCIKSGVFVEGSLIKAFDFHGVEYIQIQEWEKFATEIDVKPETISQCTGLKDKNGKLIFEGDILAGVNGSINGYPWKWGPVEVKWNDEDAKFQMWTGGTFEKQDSTHWFEVIGNIYENKDLLKDNE